MKMHDNTALARAALAVGARAYLVKSEIERHFVPAVLALTARRPYPPQRQFA